MKIQVALCQHETSLGRPEENEETVLDAMNASGADVLIFPELFLTGYGADYASLKERTEGCVMRISEACRAMDKAVALSVPRFAPEGMYNSMAFLSPDGDTWYDKAHLARFGVYSEDMFLPGKGPAMGSYHRVPFGMCICYDIFYPEVLHWCSLNGAAVNICVAASAMQSKPFLDKVVQARALENVTYLAYVNNTGTLNGLRMHGCSRALDPFGDVVCDCGTGESTTVFTADTEELREARSVRRHLADFRSDIDWRT